MNNESNQPISHKPTKKSLVRALLMLSKREGEVLIKVAEGKTNREIADEEWLSIRTIENTRARICKKLNLKGKGALKEWIEKNMMV